MILKTFLACLKAEKDYHDEKKAEDHLKKTELSVKTIAKIVSAVRDSTYKDVVVTIRTIEKGSVIQEVEFKAPGDKAKPLPEKPTEREILNQLTARLIG